MDSNPISNTVRMRCPSCLNYLMAKSDEQSTLKGHCTRCNAYFFQKQRNNKTLIKIIHK